MSEPRRPKVLMVGPLLDHYGGVSVVTSLLMRSPDLTRRADVTYIASANKHAILRKVGRFALAFAETVRILQGPDAPDIVHLHASAGPSFYRKAILAAVARRFRKRVIFQVHSGRFVDFYDDGPAVLRRAIASTLDSADVIIVLAQVWKARFASLTRNPRITVLPNPVDCAAFAAEPGQHDGATLLYLGDIAPHKGVFDLLAALAIIRGRQPEARLVLCGRGPTDQESGARPAACRSPTGWNVRVTSAGGAKQRLLREAAIYVHPAYVEALGVSLLEALAAGLPIVATRTGGIPDVVEDGVNGLLVAPGDVEALARSVIDLLNRPDRRAEIARRNRDKAVRHFDLPIVAGRLATLYTAVRSRETTRITHPAKRAENR